MRTRTYRDMPRDLKEKILSNRIMDAFFDESSQRWLIVPYPTERSFVRYLRDNDSKGLSDYARLQGETISQLLRRLRLKTKRVRNHKQCVASERSEQRLRNPKNMV